MSFGEAFESPNVVAALVAGFIAIASAFGVSSYTGRRTNTHNASEKEVEARAAYVKLLQDRVIQLEARIDEAEKAARTADAKFWDQLRELDSDYRNKMRDAAEAHRRQMIESERQWRYLGNNLVQYCLVLKLKLEEKGETVPKFTGFDSFELAGGNVPDQWKMSGLSEESGDD